MLWVGGEERIGSELIASPLRACSTKGSPPAPPPSPSSQPAVRSSSAPQERAGSRAGSPRITFLLHRKRTFTTPPRGLRNRAPKSPSPNSPKAAPAAECQKELRTAPELPGQQWCPSTSSTTVGLYFYARKATHLCSPSIAPAQCTALQSHRGAVPMGWVL